MAQHSRDNVEAASVDHPAKGLMCWYEQRADVCVCMPGMHAIWRIC